MAESLQLATLQEHEASFKGFMSHFKIQNLTL
jgi:hypothetical protein